MQDELQTISWSFSGDSKVHYVDLKIREPSGRIYIYIDDKLEKRCFGCPENDVFYEYNIDGCSVAVEIDGALPSYSDFIGSEYDAEFLHLKTQTDKQKYDCFVDGISLKTGRPMPDEKDKDILHEVELKRHWELVYQKGFKKYITEGLVKNLSYALIFAFILGILSYIRTTFFSNSGALHKFSLNDLFVNFNLTIFFVTLITTFLPPIIKKSYNWVENKKKYINIK